MWLDRITLFVEYLKGHKIVAIIGSAGLIGGVESIAKWVHFEGFTLAASYVVPMVVGFVFILSTLYCSWIRTDPRVRPSPLLLHSPPSLFSKRAQLLATYGLFVAPLLGVGTVYAVFPSPTYPTLELTLFHTNLASQRSALKSKSSSVHELFQKYRSARLQDGEQFWENAAVATKIPTAHVISHNAQMSAEVGGELVPKELVGYVDKKKTNHLACDIANLSCDIAVVVRHYVGVDRLRETLRSQPVSGDFALAQSRNLELYRYWESILLEEPLSQLVKANPSRILAAERNIEKWVMKQKHDTE